MSGIYDTVGFLAKPVATVLKGIHHVLDKELGFAPNFAWGLSIVLLTISVRVLLFPVFVKKIKSQRRMQEIAPKVKELQAKHKGDRETLNTELMKLYKDHGTNPVSGCLPLILQIPVFIALFRVMNEFKPTGVTDGVATFKPNAFGLSNHQISEAATSKIFGAPLAASFRSGKELVTTLGGQTTTVMIVTAIMIVVMGGSQFYTQRQLMARAGAAADPQQAQIQKMMLYVLPVFFAFAGINFPVGVLLYWLTTNIWSMGQQAWVIKRMPPVVPGQAAAVAKAKQDKSKDKAKGSASSTAAVEAAATASAVVTEPTAPKPTPQQRPSSGSAAGSRKNKKRKGGRR